MKARVEIAKEIDKATARLIAAERNGDVYGAQQENAYIEGLEKALEIIKKY